jgi:hypothetical protein
MYFSFFPNSLLSTACLRCMGQFWPGMPSSSSKREASLDEHHPPKVDGAGAIAFWRGEVAYDPAAGDYDAAEPHGRVRHLTTPAEAGTHVSHGPSILPEGEKGTR